MEKFKVGDQVKVTSRDSVFNGRKGIIADIYSDGGMLISSSEGLFYVNKISIKKLEKVWSVS